MTRHSCTCIHPAKDKKYDLIQAVKAGHEGCVDILINMGCDLEQIGDTHPKHTPLQIAATMGHCAIVQRLLTAGCDVTKADRMGDTALMLAIKKGYTEIVRSLLQVPGDNNVNHMNQSKQTPLSLAAQKGDLAMVHMLLDSGAKINYPDIETLRALVKDKSIVAEKYYPIVQAAHNGYFECVSVLLSAGADVTRTTLVNATRHPEVLKLLLQSNHKADSETLKKVFWTALESGQHEAVDLLMEFMDNTDENRALHRAIQFDCTSVVELLLRLGIDPESQDPFGFTPLTTAVVNGRISCVEMLLAMGVNVNDNSNIDKQTPLIALAGKRLPSKCSIACMEKLLIAGAKINMKDIRDATALDAAILPPHMMINTTPDKNCVNFLYAAGGKACRRFDYVDNIKYKPYINILLDDEKIDLALSSLCRKTIRDYMMDPKRGNHLNLLLPVSRLPLPTRLKSYLLFHVDIDLENISETEQPKQGYRYF